MILKYKVLVTLILIALMVGFIPIHPMPVYAITYNIAAVNSSTADKNAAHIVCDGISDQVEINAHLTAGDTVELYAGTYYCDDAVAPQGNNVHLTGQGNTSIIDFDFGAIFIYNVNNVEVGNLKLTGESWVGGALVIQNNTSDISGFYIHDIWCTTTEGADFVVYAIKGEISDIVFVRCDADTPDDMGFLLNGEQSPCVIQDVTFYDCTVEDAGVAATRLNDWVAGFDFVEYSGLTINRVQAINCSVDGAWESDFHFEHTPDKNDIVLLDCDAVDGGEKGVTSTFGAGFLLPFYVATQDFIADGLTGSSNEKGDMLVWDVDLGYVEHTPPIDMVLGSTKVVSDVDQSNCTGIIVTYGNFKDLYLYSNNGNPVNQEVELSDTYESNDGNTYSFNGTKIVATFTDYAVIRLVLSSESQNINGIITFATINGVATVAAINGE
jgi:hypothetical protein